MTKCKSVESSCEFLLHSVRSSNLNFICQETPYSIFLTVRKSLQKSFSQEIQDTPSLKTTPTEDAFEQLKRDLEEAVTENESKQETIDSLEKTVEILREKLSQDDAKIKALENKNNFDIHEKKKALEKFEVSDRENNTEAKDKRDMVQDYTKKIEALVK